MVELRDYQIEFVDGIRIAFTRARRVLGVSPTGSGKTVTFSYITKGAEAKGNSVMLVAHRSEIVDQISASLDAFGVRHGRIQAGRPMLTANCHVAMIQTLVRRVGSIPAPRLLVVDEAHHAVSATYSRLLEAWPDTKVLGVTATPKRLDGKGLGKWFDEMVLGPTPSALIKAGYLAKYQYLAPPNDIDLSNVKTNMGEYAIDALADAVEKSTILGDAIEHYQRYLTGRPAIAFCVTVKHAEAVAQSFRDAGIRSASVDGRMNRETRADRIRGIGNGEIQVLTSCELISEGVDIPVVAGAILMRPTKSLSVHLQQIGRALRPKADGSDAVIIDHVGNVDKHGLPDAHQDWTLADQKKDKAQPTATCDVCFRVFNSGYPKWQMDAVCGKDPDNTEDVKLLSVAKKYRDAGGGEDERIDLADLSDDPDFSIKTRRVDPKLAEALEYARTSTRTIECVLVEGGGIGRSAPEQQEGSLEIVTPTPEWARGANIAADPLSSFMHLADTLEQIGQVARMRRYHPKWTKKVWAAKQASALRLAEQEKMRWQRPET